MLGSESHATHTTHTAHAAAHSAQSACRRIVATLAAFCSADRSTLAGVRTPCFSRSPYSSVNALKPKAKFDLAAPPSVTLLTTTEPLAPAFSAMVQSGTARALYTTSIPAA
jgi:hypothetical protein